MRAVSTLLTSFWRERGGLAAVEFALVLPLAVAILFGEFVLGEALSINRKMSIASRTLADLVARQKTLTNADLSDLMTAVTQMAAPYGNANMGVIVAEFTTDAARKTTVTWSRSLHASAFTAGTVVTLPAGMAQANTSLIYTKVLYGYTPPVGQAMFGTVPISNDFYMPPRISADVKLN